MRNTGLEEAQAGIKIVGRYINNLRYADDTTLMAESEEELKSLLMKVKEVIGKVGLKPNIQKTKIIASGPITSWQIDGETVEIVSDFICWGSKITADGECNHEMRRCLLLGRKVMTNLDSILKSRDITLPTKVLLVKVMVFPVVMNGCESWTIKNSGWASLGAGHRGWRGANNAPAEGVEQKQTSGPCWEVGCGEGSSGKASCLQTAGVRACMPGPMATKGQGFVYRTPWGVRNTPSPRSRPSVTLVVG